MKKIIIILICIILLTSFILLKYFNKLKNKTYININTSKETIEKIKNETGASAKTELYGSVKE